MLIQQYRGAYDRTAVLKATLRVLIYVTQRQAHTTQINDKRKILYLQAIRLKFRRTNRTSMLKNRVTPSRFINCSVRISAGTVYFAYFVIF